MSNIQIQSAFVVDGKVFASKEEAMDFIRKPQILAAMQQVTDNNDELSAWLVENQETIEMAFETGTIRRVSKQEAKKLSEALEHIASVLSGDKKAAFVTENIGAIKDSFRWPSVKRLTAEEKLTVARNTLMAASENNEDLVTWILENKDAVLQAYTAGKVKREVPESAKTALAEYRARKAAEKAAAEAAKAE